MVAAAAGVQVVIGDVGVDGAGGVDDADDAVGGCVSVVWFGGVSAGVAGGKVRQRRGTGK